MHEAEAILEMGRCRSQQTAQLRDCFQILLPHLQACMHQRDNAAAQPLLVAHASFQLELAADLFSRHQLVECFHDIVSPERMC